MAVEFAEEKRRNSVALVDMNLVYGEIRCSWKSSQI